MDFNELGNRCKAFESRFNSDTFMPGIPIIARLDGRAFHTFTKGLSRPFDDNFITCMSATTKELVAEFNADLGYTQSDEITLVWFSGAGQELMFGGKAFKLISILASSCSLFFYKNVITFLPSKATTTPVFDCRMWQVPDKDEAALVLYWRERDATRNSIMMLAQSVFSHKELQGKKINDIHNMLHDVEINWNDLPSYKKRGIYFCKTPVMETIDLTGRMDIPEAQRKKIDVTRSRVVQLDVPILNIKENLVDQLFERNM